MARTKPDFGAVVLRHQIDVTEVVRLWWISLLAFLMAFMLIAGLVFDPRPGPPRAVYFLMWALFMAGLVRAAFVRYFSTPFVLLERGIYLPIFRPRHRVAVSKRALALADITCVRLDESSFRTGSHVFETARGPIRCPKAYFPPPKKLAGELKALAPSIEVVFEDARGRRRKYSPLVTRRRGRDSGGKRAQPK